MKREPMFKTEAELCAAFIGWLKRWPEWTPYAETEGWDILLVHADGTQVGIQAKMKFNMEVLRQAVESDSVWHTTGPDFRAVLVPSGQGSELICNALGLTLIRSNESYPPRVSFNPEFIENSYKTWHYRNPPERHRLPAYVPDNPAGVPSPSPLTKWKIGALEIVAILEVRGFVDRMDFKIAGIDHRLWITSWLEPAAAGTWKWVQGSAARGDNWIRNHPTVYPQIRGKVRERLGAGLVLT